MAVIEERERRIVGGVDTHKDLHVAAVVDEQDQGIETRCFATTRQGYRQMLAWMRSLGDLQRIGVESTGSYRPQSSVDWGHFGADPTSAERRWAPIAASDCDLCRRDCCCLFDDRPGVGGRETCAARVPGLPTRRPSLRGLRHGGRTAVQHSGELIRAVMRVESFGDATAVSRKGAIGLMQVMPKTYAELRVRHGLGADSRDPHDNILAGAAYLREMLYRYGAPGFLAAYNAGPARYDEHLIKGRPLPGETQDYVAKLAPMIGVQQGEDQKGAAFDLFVRLHAALFPPHADPSPCAVLLAVRSQPDRSLAVRRVVDLSALAPSSEGLFVRLAIETGSR
jgi:hypothetical protein